MHIIFYVVIFLLLLLIIIHFKCMFYVTVMHALRFYVVFF